MKTLGKINTTDGIVDFVLIPLSFTGDEQKQDVLLVDFCREPNKRYLTAVKHGTCLPIHGKFEFTTTIYQSEMRYNIYYGRKVLLDDGSIVKVNSVDNKFNQFDYVNGIKTVLLCQDSIMAVL